MTLQTNHQFGMNTRKMIPRTYSYVMDEKNISCLNGGLVGGWASDQNPVTGFVAACLETGTEQNSYPTSPIVGATPPGFLLTSMTMYTAPYNSRKKGLSSRATHSLTVRHPGHPTCMICWGDVLMAPTCVPQLLQMPMLCDAIRGWLHSRTELVQVLPAGHSSQPLPFEPNHNMLAVLALDTSNDRRHDPC
jgi:hypothetical protein